MFRDECQVLVSTRYQHTAITTDEMAGHGKLDRLGHAEVARPERAAWFESALPIVHTTAHFDIGQQLKPMRAWSAQSLR